jgi:anaerobic ribonucleoside-triphosphate reductase activating protein
VDTWAEGRGETTVDKVLATILPWIPEADGITISGGEPFEQLQGLEALLHGLRELPKAERDILVYSGYSWEEISIQVTTWGGLADVLISDPFRSESGQTLAWRGSDNQRMHLLTELGRKRYSSWVMAPRNTISKAIDVFFQNGEVWMAGIPEPGSLEALRTRLAEEGFVSKSSQAQSSHLDILPVFA